ncbi:putative disease resistance RPP13-like protein 3 [Salvia miltiorrhiza]|uniref:putative disease resistance RPP13-like protein 3 n=1 Tax=Salvia miltiorrhiza TaxID=226208 RepID=UPI0025AD4EC8|nr:putative disease resistance RPP13-like protein 3 [Salvia miltiorrhiza]
MLKVQIPEISSSISLADDQSPGDFRIKTRSSQLSTPFGGGSSGEKDLVRQLPSESSRRLAQRQKDKQVVGMEKDIELLLEKAILDGGENLSISAIVGAGGTRKSTLARALYNHAAVADRFERRAWVVASKELSPRDIIKELYLLVKFGETDKFQLYISERLTVSELQQKLHKRLEGKRYFIVLDDMWDDAHQRLLQFYHTSFRWTGTSSRFLLTMHTPQPEDDYGYVHTMKCLDSDESWILFLNTVSDGKGVDQDLEDIGRQILNKCDGLPLAITLVAEKVGDTINTRKLIDVWISEGIIPEEGGKTMEETAMAYLEELIDRNMVQIKDISFDDCIKSCVMHDLVRDLSIKKAEEEIRFEILSADVSICALIGLRYLSVRNTNIQYIPNWLPRLVNLEVLDIRGLVYIEFSDILGKMHRLRCLYASSFYFGKPPEISSLKFLQKLSYVINFYDSNIHKVLHMTNLSELGINLFRISDSWLLFNILEEMENLVHLKLKYCKTLNLDMLYSLRRITRLKLHGEIPLLPSVFPLNLSHLTLDWCRLKEDAMPLLQSLPKLSHLKLKSAYEGAGMVISRTGFPALKVLILHSLSRLESMLVEEGAMPELRRLEINRCSSLERLPEEMTRNLEELKIVASKKIASMLQGEDSQKISSVAYVEIIGDSGTTDW